jgi:hypothetical protein
MPQKDEIDHTTILKLGAAFWNSWRDNNPKVKPNLRGANLSSIIISGVDLRNAILRDANLEKAIIRYGNLRGCDCSGANFAGADLNHANLRSVNFTNAILSNSDLADTNLTHAKLCNAVLSEADLYLANLNHADLTEADLSKAKVGRVLFTDVDLSTVKGLDTLQYLGPSTIGVDTIYRSKGNISESFLRGIGVPEDFIIYITSLTKQAFEFYTCFISYSNKDQAFTERLYADLQSKGVRCWYAPEDLPIGEKLRIGIDDSIRKHDKLLLVLSKHSVESQWVEKEVETAFEQERLQNRMVLFPIRLDDTIMRIETGWAADIRRTRNIGDFRSWKKHDKYKKVFDRLLRDLKIKTRFDNHGN